MPIHLSVDREIYQRLNHFLVFMKFGIGVGYKTFSRFKNDSENLPLLSSIFVQLRLNLI
jgi:hypothetical protein